MQKVLVRECTQLVGAWLNTVIMINLRTTVDTSIEESKFIIQIIYNVRNEKVMKNQNKITQLKGKA